MIYEKYTEKKFLIWAPQGGDRSKGGLTLRKLQRIIFPWNSKRF